MNPTTDMGAAAYYQVDQTFKTWFADAFGPVFKELANRFMECVHHRCSKAVYGTDGSTSILRLYRNGYITAMRMLIHITSIRYLGLPPHSHLD